MSNFLRNKDLPQLTIKKAEKSTKIFYRIKKGSYICTRNQGIPDETLGEMAEWSNAAVLKTVEGHTSGGGSNPSFSAKETRNESYGFLFFTTTLKNLFS